MKAIKSMKPKSDSNNTAGAACSPSLFDAPPSFPDLFQANVQSEGSPPSRIENKQERNGDSLH
jgi:hypothetical protein